MKTTGWAVKTKHGKIFPTWIFDNREEAQDFAEKLNEWNHPKSYAPVEVEIKSTPPTV